MTTITMNIPASVDRVMIRMMRGAINNPRTRARTSRRENKFHADIKQVHELPPHLLRDIGLMEDQIISDLFGNPHKGGF